KVEIRGSVAVGRDCWARVQSADVLLEIEPRLRVERLHFRPIRRARDQRAVVDSFVPGWVAARPPLQLVAVTKREVEVGRTGWTVSVRGPRFHNISGTCFSAKGRDAERRDAGIPGISGYRERRSTSSRN